MAVDYSTRLVGKLDHWQWIKNWAFLDDFKFVSVYVERHLKVGNSIDSVIKGLEEKLKPISLREDGREKCG